ncbi:transposable element Tcb2 transposase [Trichonephila clavipes]|nr:transposable element Tcb2 transposase [Trichonephila clavipes]
MITIATNCGKFEQYSIHKRSFTALRYSFPARIARAVFQQDNARPHVAKTVKSYLDSQQVQLLPWPAYSPDMSPIEHEWDIVGRRIARDLRPVASTDELWLRIQTIWNTLPQTDIKNLFNSMPRRVAALIAARGGHTKY